jgi:transcriptional regulator with XRE-family HTH domain
MPRRPRGRIRIGAVVEGRRLAQLAAAKLGQAIRAARLRRHWTQKRLAEMVGLSASRVAQVERGKGVGVSAETWFAFSVALDVPLRVEFVRDALAEPTDAGHLAMQELMLRLGRQLGCTRTLELPTRPADPALSVDVGWRDDVRRVLILNECWNTFGSINASVRSTNRKVAEAPALAAALGGEGEPYRVASCWIVRDTRGNRALIARYPEVFASAFPASSVNWVRALTVAGAPVPDLPGLVWSDLGATRLFTWRKSARAEPAT